jgi:hypothetical protein
MPCLGESKEPFVAASGVVHGLHAAIIGEIRDVLRAMLSESGACPRRTLTSIWGVEEPKRSTLESLRRTILEIVSGAETGALAGWG